MANKVSENSIKDMSQDWGLDTSNGLPYSGGAVQQFIKEKLNSKMGYFHYDAANNRYMVFADEATKDKYLEDPTQTDLLLGTFDAPFNYTAEIALTTPTYNAIFLGSIGNYIDFTFDIKNKAGASTGENVYVTYTIVHNATKRVITETRRFGESVHFNIDQYLNEGANTIIVGISGQTTLAATTVAITYQVVDLQLTDELNISKVYNLSGGSTEMEVIWSVKGYGTKVVEWYVDGVLQPFDRVVDEVVAIEGGSPKYITLSALGNGRHSLQMRAYTTINGEKFYTDTLYRDFIVYDGTSTTPTIGVALTIPKEYGVVTPSESLIIYDIVQYVPYTFRFATFSPTGEASMNVDVFVGDEKKGSVASKNGSVNEFLFVSNKTGATSLRLVADGAELSIPANVAVTSMNLREITEGLMFNFNANGRSNNATDKDQWSYGDYTATFQGFNWNSTSGWVNNCLRISDGASFGVNFAPLGGNPIALGRTVEVEFSTTNVTNDDAVICDLRQDGVGILITATKVLLHSEEGVEIVNEFKENENVRFSFVMNRISGVTNKGLAFIYTNGIVARCANYSITDNFASAANILFTGTSEAQVLLKQILVFNQALSSDDILNNFTLYRDNVADMMAVYDRNDVYEEGTVTFSPDKMVNRLPVMIVTGNIPTLENTNDKDTQIVVDIEYTNMQDPSKNFTMTGAAMRPQGTSSMGYPKKNFRIYTKKVDGTILKDAQGNIVPDKLYAFTQGAQPVDTWCLKADYAESSGTHNTGIARMWHDILMNTQLNGEYVLRTEAQKAAIAAGYEYDVRTTIDGFPILLFYRKNATSDLIFIGKYNFNNDKSTESVFGFKGIPNFNNSRMQCWEILNNGNDIALFTDISDFYKTITVGNETQEGWKFAFESRYPDKSTVTADLYSFATWMNSVSQEAFATEKWAHMDVYKMAAYYCYLMRFAGADQFVKNAMLTSEDGEHFYFILYDNDTINGLINTGRLAISPSDNRQTKDASGEYVFAGHDSVLWNRLEADTEFMGIVSAIDDAMFSAGLSYENAIHFFDELQAEKWVERVYNQDAQYKYITPYVESGTNNLFMLQGDRAIHRKWFLAKRFALYDSLLVSGAYKSQSMEFKCINNTQAGQTFTVTSGNNMNYGYGINDVPREVGVSLDVNESYDFVTKETVNLGDPIRLYAAPNIKGLDFSKMTARLATMDITKVYTESLGTQLTSLIIGNASATNNELTTISGLNKANKLEVLDVQGCKGLTSLDLSNQPYFKTLKAKGSSVASVVFAKGAPVERIELPSLVKTLTLSQLPYLDGTNVEIDGGWGNITSINVTECPNVTNDFSLVWNWFNAVTPSNCSLVMDNVAWEGMSVTQLVTLKSNLGAFNVRGYARFTSLTREEVAMLKGVFGDSVFDKGQSFYITAPAMVFITGESVVGDGESMQYSHALVGDIAEGGTIKYSISSGSNSYVSINEDTGLLTTTERGSEYNITVRVTYTYNGTSTYDEMSVQVKKLVYPANATINGSNSVDNELETYTWSTTTTGITGEFNAEWSLSGDAYEQGYITIQSQDNEKIVIKLLKTPTGLYNATLTLVLKKTNGTVLVTATKTITAKDPNLAITSDTNPAIMSIMYSNGLAANENYMTKAECAAVTESQLQPGTSYSTSIFYSQRNNITSFDEFKYFTGLTTVSNYLFYSCSKLSSIVIPDGVTKIGYEVFYRCSSLNSIILPTTLNRLDGECFYSCSKLSSIVIPEGVTYIEDRCFYSCSQLKSIIIPNNVTYLGKGCFYNCTALESIQLSSGLRKIQNTCFYYCSKLASVVIPELVTEIDSQAFYNCHALTYVTLPSLLTFIRDSAFSSCYSLQAVTIGENVTSIDNSCFIGCGNLDINVVSSNLNYSSVDGVLFSKDGTQILAYAKDVKQNTYEIPNTVKIIANGCFRSCKSLTSVTIPYGVEILDAYCFYECNNLTSITIPDSVISLGDYAFAAGGSVYSGLTSIEIPNSVTSIGEECFKYCYYLTTINLPNTITTIKTGTFRYCKALKEIDLPSSISSIGDGAFDGAGLTSIVIPESVTRLSIRAFRNCKSLLSITIPDSNIVCGEDVFRGCTALKTITSLRKTAIEARNMWGVSNSDYTGRNTYNTGENMLYVPQGATGYDTGYWLDPLQNAEKCGFTLSATL